MDVDILGPLNVRDGGHAVAIVGLKRRLLMTMLAVHAPDAVSIDALVDALWGDDASDASAATLQTYVYQIRKLLGPASVVTRPPGYALGVPAECIDARRFEALVKREPATADLSLADRRRRLAAALALWRAAPLTEFSDIAPLAAEATRLGELRLRALEERIDADLELGHHGDLVGELELLVAEHPLHERFWAQLMLALYRSDRQTDALRAFARLRRRLADEIGLTPSPALRLLEQQILDHDAALTWHRAPRSAPPGAARTVVAEATGATVAVLFTDIEGSTRRWEEYPDEMGVALAEHDRIMRAAFDATDGEVFATAGDSFAVRFDDPAPALDAAVRAQVALGEADWSTVGGLRVRMGIHVGHVEIRDGQMFGPTLNRAARLHSAGHGGQVLVSAAVVAKLGDRLPEAAGVVDLGEHRLRDIGQKERVYQLTHPRLDATFPPLRAEMRPGEVDSPFVGRHGEVDHLSDRIEQIRSGSGGVVMLVGEAGIGKTRTARVAAERSRASGTTVLWGRCTDGPWSPPYGPFAEAITDHVRDTGRPASEVLGERASTLAPLLPDELASQINGPIAPDDIDAIELQMQMFAAVTGFIVDLADTTPVLLVLEDLHWADEATIALLRHLARVLADHSVLVLGNFRDDEVGPQHPLTGVLGTLPRETAFERIRLRGLGSLDVAELAGAMVAAGVSEAVSATVHGDTGGNPFFVQQVLRQLASREPDTPSDVVAVPVSVVDVIEHRVARLPEVSQRLLRAVSIFDGDFEFPVGAQIAGLDEELALDALDGALDAHLLDPTERPDVYRFTHALARHALAVGLNPSRQLRMHRRAAEALLAAAPENAVDPIRAAQIAAHFLRSAALGGADRGIGPAIIAAEHATATGAHDDAIRYLTMAFELAPPGHVEHPEVLGRLGCAYARAAQYDEAVVRIHSAIDQMADLYGPDRAADFAVVATRALGEGLEAPDPEVAVHGLRYIGDRRDITWARLLVTTIDALPPGERTTAVEGADFALASRIMLDDSPNPGYGIVLLATHPTRADLLRLDGWPSARMMGAGDLRSTVAEFAVMAASARRDGRLLTWAKCTAYEVHCHVALGNLDRAEELLDDIAETNLPVTPGSEVEVRLLLAAYLLASARDAGWSKIGRFASRLSDQMVLADRLRTRGGAARHGPGDELFVIGPAKILARSGDAEHAVQNLDSLSRTLTGLGGPLSWHRVVVHDFVEVLWYADHVAHLDLAEHLVDAQLQPDLRSPMCCMRLSTARLQALRGRTEQAGVWFAESRASLDDTGARTLRAVVDFDESLMHVRLGTEGNADLARDLMGRAISEFETIGMSGWLERAEAIQSTFDR